MTLPYGIKTSTAAVAAILAGVSLAGCTAKETKSADSSSKAPSEITVNATDTDCKLSGTQAATGPSTFVITNNGTKVTEFYVYGEGERVMGEVENISPACSASSSCSSPSRVSTRPHASRG